MAKKHYANNEKGSADFLEHVYSRGLADIIQHLLGPQEGRFGKTKMAYVVHEGSTYLRFACFAADFGHEHAERDRMDYAQFKVDDDGEGNLALFLGSCAMTCDLPEKMFRDVIAHWPANATAQKAAFQPMPKN